MADVFISYSHEDHDTAQALASLLVAKGWSVWWDRQIKTGQPFDREIEKALMSARCVIVLWSRTSVESDWVRAEATEALQQKKLIPVVIEKQIDPPLRFRQIETRFLTKRMHPNPQELERLFSDVHVLAPLPYVPPEAEKVTQPKVTSTSQEPRAHERSITHRVPKPTVSVSPKRDIINRIRRILADKLSLDVGSIRPESYIVQDLGADELDLVEFAMAVEEEFETMIPESDVNDPDTKDLKLVTVQDWALYIQGREA